jgi:predicted nucleic acid-binding protein
MALVLFDTSAIYALADRADPNHRLAVERLGKVVKAGHSLFLHSYLLVEAAALLQRRLGLEVALRFLEDAGALRVHWVTAQDHQQAVALLRDRGRRGLSLVDCTSFVVMRRYGANLAFAFDDDFLGEGFQLLE